MRALDASGLDFRSDKLWTQYIDWEISVNDIMRASQVYDILLATPTMEHSAHFERYKQFVERFEPDQILNPQEYESISDLVYDKIKHDLDGGPMFFWDEYEQDIPDEEVREDGLMKRLVRRRKHVDTALTEFRHEILRRRRKLHRSNEEAVNERLKFENGVCLWVLRGVGLDLTAILNLRFVFSAKNYDAKYL